MSLKPFARSRSRVLVAGLAAGLTLALAFVNPANAANPPGSPIRIFIDSTSSANPSDAISNGWWGHEGGVANNGTGTGTSFLDTDGSDPALATTFPDLSKVRVAFVTTSSDGSAEHPMVTAGEAVGDAFTWFMDAGVQTGLNGNTNPNDSVVTVSTGAEFNAWTAATSPVQGYDNSLVLHDVTAPGDPVSTAPQGKSILNRWPAGSHISLVFYATTGALDAHGEPIVAVGADGHAITAYMPFDTVARSTDATRSSAGYSVVGTTYKPTVTVTHTFSGSTATLTATVKNKLNTVATDATGTMNFALYSGGVDQPPTAVTVTNGVATLQVPGFTPGAAKTYHVVYVPDSAAQATYLQSDPATHTVVAPIATSTSLSITGSTSHTFTAKVSPAAAGTVTFKNGSSVLGSASVSGGSAHIVKSLSAGKHVIQAIFTPSSATYAGSSTTRTVYQATVTATLKPTHGRRGTRPVVTVRVVASGTTPGGKVVIVFHPPSGPTKKFTVTLSHGVAKFKLPRTVRGSTKITAMYGGSGAVLAANSKTVIFKAT